MSKNDPMAPSRRRALQCLAFGGAGTLFTLSGGVLTPFDLALAAPTQTPRPAAPLFLQISDTHIGFNKEANPDVAGTLNADHRAGERDARRSPLLTLHTGDITHLSKPAEFDLAAQLLSQPARQRAAHDARRARRRRRPGTEYFDRYGKASGNRGYYSFDHQGVHFIGLINVLKFKPNGLGDPRRRAARVAEDRPEGALRQHAHRGVRAHAAVDHL